MPGMIVPDVARAALYRFWSDYPKRDVEYVRWYPPTLHGVDPAEILKAIETLTDDPAFYLHVPFCKDICPYCPFNKFRMRQDRAEQFLQAFDVELQWVAGGLRTAGRRARSGYLGGGTPTALAADDLLGLVAACTRELRLLPDAELTVEANPDTVDASLLTRLRHAGVNRISFGVQSFSDEHLQVLGRTHGRSGALNAISLAQAAGFDNIAIDLIYRIPGQSVDDWRSDLHTAIDLGVQHVSTYCLFLDPGTRLYNASMAGHVGSYPDEATEIEMYDVAADTLRAAGYDHYTINDYALSGRQSDHHLVNWQAPQGSYVGMGPGAFGFLRGRSGVTPYCTIHNLGAYIASVERGQLPVRLGHFLSREERRARFMVLGLRCLSVDKRAFEREHGEEFDAVFAATVTELARRGLVAHDSERVWMTRRGMHYASNVLKAFYTEPNYGKPQPIGVELLAGRGLSMVSVTPARKA